MACGRGIVTSSPLPLPTGRRGVLELKRRYRRLPTDREILQAIYDRHAPQYEAVSRGDDTEASDNRIYFPVDLAAVADELRADRNLVFGRLNYYLDRRYAYRSELDGLRTHLFWLRFDRPEGKHWVNFPLMASVLAGLQEDYHRVMWTRRLAVGSFAVSFAALALSAFTAFWSILTPP